MSDELTPENRALVAYIRRTLAAGVVLQLLDGNDVQCFSTEQFIDRYDRNPRVACGPFGRMDVDAARQRLRGLPGLVREVRPDVWAAVGGPTP